MFKIHELPHDKPSNVISFSVIRAFLYVFISYRSHASSVGYLCCLFLCISWSQFEVVVSLSSCISPHDLHVCIPGNNLVFVTLSVITRRRLGRLGYRRAVSYMQETLFASAKHASKLETSNRLRLCDRYCV